jgi:adenylyltransferase/sulfurtransferase
VVGAGGTGTAVLQYLASIGVGHLTIIDNGMVEESSIQRQTLYGVTDLGKLKTIISRQKLQAIYPLSEYEIINLKLDNNNSNNILEPFDLIIDASNNLQTNYIINDTCINLNKPWIFSSVNGSFVKISVFNFMNGPSLRCYNQNLDYNSDLAISLTFALSGIYTSIEALKLITNQENILNGKLLKMDCFKYSYELIQVNRNENNFVKQSSRLI